MIIKNAYIFILFLAFFSCHQKRNPTENTPICDSLFTMNGYSYKGIEDTCLSLLNNSINSNNAFSINVKKLQVLQSKKDINTMLKTNNEIIKLIPDNPTWIIQRGLFFDIKGDSTEAQRHYKKGLSKFEKLMKTGDYSDYNIRIAYISALEYNNAHTKAIEELNKLSIDFPNNKIVKTVVNNYSKNHLSKSQIIQLFWED